MRAIFVILLCLVATYSFAGEYIIDNTKGCKVRTSMPKLTASWSGDCVGGIANGNGIIRFYKDQKLFLTYDGALKDGKINGKGTLTWPDGTKYVGELKDGAPDGEGAFTFFGGTKYVGEFKDGKFDGKGTLPRESGYKYVGEFKNSKLNGQSPYRGKW